jgi:glycosyltransferase involved in cell wall biosynthesis
MGYETVRSIGYVASLLGTARNLGIAERISYLGPRNRPEMIRVCATCDVGIAFLPIPPESINMSKLTGASNKVFDYLACGLPIIVTDEPDWRRLFVEPGYGAACDPENVASIAAAIRWFFDNPGQMRNMGESGRHRIQTDWNYESQFQPVLDAITGRHG